MNHLGQNVLDIMAESNLGMMSVHVLKKQSMDSGLDLNTLSRKDINKLSEKLKVVLPFFIGDEADGVLMRIKRLGNDGNKIGGQ